MLPSPFIKQAAPWGAIGKFVTNAVPAYGTAMVGSSMQNLGKSFQWLSRGLGAKRFNKVRTDGNGVRELIMDKNNVNAANNRIRHGAKYIDGEWKTGNGTGVAGWLGRTGDRLESYGNIYNHKAGQMVGLGSKGRNIAGKLAFHGPIGLMLGGQVAGSLDTAINGSVDNEASGFWGKTARGLNKGFSAINESPIGTLAESTFLPFQLHAIWGPGMHLAESGITNGLQWIGDTEAKKNMSTASRAAVQTLAGVGDGLNAHPIGKMFSDQVMTAGLPRIRMEIEGQARQLAEQSAANRGMTPGSKEYNDFVNTYVGEAMQEWTDPKTGYDRFIQH